MNINGQELNEVIALFVKMGAPQKQAEVMASQLLKRASQIAAERDISIIEAAEILLKQVVQAQQGAVSGSDKGSEP
jgi:hypothetical protein